MFCFCYIKINHKNTKIFKNLLLLGNGTITRSPNKSPPETENNEYVIIGVLVSTAALCLVALEFTELAGK